MNCCDDYGECTQGRDCPVRTGIITPAQKAHMECTVTKAGAQRSCEEPIEPYSTWMLVLIWVCLALLSVVSMALLGAGAGYIYARWLA